MTSTPRDGSPPVEQELKACPWCEGTRLDRRSRTDSNGNFQAYIECDDCGACGPASAWYATEEGAFKWLANGDYNWNTRISHAPAAVGRDIMREALERINLMATNHAGQFDQDPFCEYVKLGEIAGEALNAAALSASAASPPLSEVGREARDSRAFPDAADGTPILLMEAEIWSAGADLETAKFVARVLGDRGYRLEGGPDAPPATETGWDWRSRHGSLRARIIAETAEEVTFEYRHAVEVCPHGTLTMAKTDFSGVYVCDPATDAALSRPVPPVEGVEERAREMVADDFRERGFNEHEIATFIGSGDDDQLPYAPARAMIRIAKRALSSPPAVPGEADPVFAYLLGEGPLEGRWFGDPEGVSPVVKHRGNFWWRKHLRAALDAASTRQGGEA